MNELEYRVTRLVEKDKKFMEMAKETIASGFYRTNMINLISEHTLWVKEYTDTVHIVVHNANSPDLIPLIHDDNGIFKPHEEITLNPNDYSDWRKKEGAEEVLRLIETHIEQIILLTTFILVHAQVLIEENNSSSTDNHGHYLS